MDILFQKHIQLIKDTDLSFQRYLIAKLPWNERLIGIKGARGVGKTTLILQHIKQTYGLSTDALYISLDNLYFSNNNLSEFVDEFVNKGGTHLFIDEVHKYKNWSIELKNIYDTHTKLKVVFTGSSLLEILNSRSDLSRRALVYSMQGMSFREYLNYTLNQKFDAFSIEELLQNHQQLSLEITDKIKPLKYFDTYIEIGYFPFFEKNKQLYYKRLQEIINMIIEIELPLLRKTDISISYKIKQLLYIISQSVPYKPNISQLAKKIKVTRTTIINYINALHDAKVLKLLSKDAFGNSKLQKPEKLFLENTNYMFAIINSIPNKGNLRETFILNQLSENNQITYPKKGDFLINDTFLIEVGGKNKTTKQIQNISNSYLAIDDIEIGYDNKIPLWLFGFLY